MKSLCMAELFKEAVDGEYGTSVVNLGKPGGTGRQSTNVVFSSWNFRSKAYEEGDA